MAKSSTFNVSIKLLTDNFNKGLKGIQKQLRGFGNFVKASFALGSITAFGRQIVQVSSEFEDSMARVKAVSNASAEGFKMMADEARKLGATTKYTATEAANALENLTRNGMSATQATQALSGVLQLAQANSIGLAEAADILSNTLNMFGLKASETTRVNDVLSATASHSATNISLLYEALVNAAPAAKALGIGLEETSAAIGALAQKGVKGANAGTALRMALTKMVDPKIVGKMQAMGVAVDEQTIKEEGLLGVVKRLKDAHLEMGDLVAIFSQRGAVGMQQLIDAYDDFDLMLEVTKSSAGTTLRMFEQGVGSTKKAIDTLKSTYESFLISLGQKTSGAVNGAINLLIKLIKNFETVGGTILNIASVIVPLFTKRIVTMFTVFSTGAKKAAVEAATLRAAMGDWITLIATAATWLVTGLVANMSKVNKEIKEHNEQLAEAYKKTNNLKEKVSSLLSELGPNTDKTTLAGVVKQLTELFPDFTREIMSAAVEAGKDGNYKRLKDLLQDIVDLQSKVSTNALLQGGITLNAQKLREIMVNARPAAMGAKPQGEAATAQTNMYTLVKGVEKWLKDHGYSGEAVEDARNSVLEDMTTEWSKAWSPKQGTDKIRQRYSEMLTGFSDEFLNSVGAAIRGEEASKQIFAAAEDLRANEIGSRVAQARIDKMREKEEQETADRLEQEENNKNAAKKIADIEKEYQSAIRDAEDDYKLAGESAEALRAKLIKLGEAAETAYDAYRKQTGKTGVANPYYSEMQKASKNQRNAKITVNGEQVDLYPKGIVGGNSVSGPNQVKGPKERPIPGGKAHPVIYNEDFYDYVGYVDDAIMATDNFANTLNSLASSFEVLSDADSTWIERLSASTRILQNMANTVFDVIGMINKLGDIEELAAKKEAVLSALNLKRKKKEIVANTSAAASAGAESQAGIPIVGPILAAAAVATILALMATLPKFSKGGVFTGGSHHGDKMLARVNSGEMILNNRQQRNLLDIANGKAVANGGKFEFVIQGKTLKAVQRNYDNATTRIAGQKGF